MRNYNRLFLFSVIAGLLMCGVACSSESPFGGEEEGILKLKLVVNGELTRADDEAHLAETAVIYISSSKGLIGKYMGLDNVPSQLRLATGSYVAEAWAGDSVTASFDKKFYRTYQPFTITTGVNNLILNCKIANVVASINPESVDNTMMSDWTLTVGNSRGSLDFTSENIADKAYFMMPNADTDLSWTLKGTGQNGDAFEKTGTIENVQRAHEYIFNLQFGGGTTGDDPNGGAYITVTIDDTVIEVDHEVTIHSAPILEGVGFDFEDGLLGESGKFETTYINAITYGQYSQWEVTFSNPSAFGVNYASYDLVRVSGEPLAQLNDAGFTWYTEYSDEHTTGNITIAKEMLNRLPEGEYTISFKMESDRISATAERILKISVNDDEVIITEEADAAVASYFLQVPVTVSLKDDAVTNPAVLYRAVGTYDWSSAAATSSRSATYTATLTGLKPGTKYEYKGASDGFESKTLHYVTTTAAFTLPNAGFEDWSTTSALVADTPFPGTGSTVTFWDTGNHGSMTMKKAITNKSEEIKHGGKYSAKLESQFVGITSTIGKFAAGNIFAGAYVGTDGTDGILEFGRPFTGPKPAKLRGWIHFRPAAITNSSISEAPVGNTDEGEIYIALTKGAVEIRTKNQSSLFGAHMDQCVCYTSLKLTKNYGTDAGEMEQFEIPFTVMAGMEKEIPTHIVIVASASRWGDYFTGGPSVMYLDDLELVYE